MSCDHRSLQLSLISFKERVTSQQKRIEELETENRELRSRMANQTTSVLERESRELRSRNEDAVVIRQLEEANLHLRQRNLELTQALLNKNMSLSSIGSFNEGFGGGAGGESLAAACDDVINDVTGDACSLDGLDQLTDQPAKLEQLNMNKILEIKRVLLDQQKSLMTAIHRAREETARKVRENKKAENKKAATCDHQTETEGAGDSEVARCCPMCEVAFPEEQVSLEDFESHVLEHFSYEDRSMDTIHNFDLMLDAPSSFDGDFG